MNSVFSAVRMLGLAVIAGCLLAGSPAPVEAADSGVFQKLAGNWKCQRGGCWVKPVGAKVAERLGCRVNYGVSGASLTQSINCKGSIQLTANSKLSQQGNRVSGSFTSFNNQTGRINGSASGVVTDSRMSVGITADDGKTGAMRATIGTDSQVVELYEVRSGKRYKVGQLSLTR
jgi:hypothetical protein